MTYLFKLARRAARLRALPFVALASALVGCDTDRLTSVSDEPAAGGNAESGIMSGAPSFASSFRGGIPFGTFHLPKEEYGTIYNGSLANIAPEYLLSYLEAARSSGTRLMLSLVGGERNYRNSDHTFSLPMWKQRVNRYRGIDFSSYIQDGTVIGHYLIDEPHDKSNWGGTQISPATLDEMAKFSKELWPSMATIVRAWPVYLKGVNYKYLDAAWAQYAAEYGASSQRLPIHIFTANNVRDAKAAGLALVVGINLLGGGSSAGLPGYYPGEKAPNARELEAWGSALLDDPYPCAFISWKHHDGYLGRSDIKSAMAALSQKARAHPTRSCSASPVELPSGTPGIGLKVTARVERGYQYMTLTWSGAVGGTVRVYRNGVLVKNTENDGRYVNRLRHRRATTYVYRLCENRGSRCSNQQSVRVR
jgi:hypothetical protein